MYRSWAWGLTRVFAPKGIKREIAKSIDQASRILRIQSRIHKLSMATLLLSIIGLFGSINSGVATLLVSSPDLVELFSLFFMINAVIVAASFTCFFIFEYRISFFSEVKTRKLIRSLFGAYERPVRTTDKLQRKINKLEEACNLLVEVVVEQHKNQNINRYALNDEAPRARLTGV